MSIKTANIKLNTVTIQYNGKRKDFENVVRSMIFEFLSSCSIAKDKQTGFIGNVENIEKQK